VEQNLPSPKISSDNNVITLADISLDDVRYIREPTVKISHRDVIALTPQRRILLDRALAFKHAPDHIPGQEIRFSACFIGQSL